jgi:hypothetical protein
MNRYFYVGLVIFNSTFVVEFTIQMTPSFIRYLHEGTIVGVNFASFKLFS